MRAAGSVAFAWIAASVGFAGVARADGAAAGGELVERFEVDLPATPGAVLAVENPLGPVYLRAWDRPEIRVLADKRGPSRELVSRLRVHGELHGGVAQVTTRVLLTGPQGEMGLPLEAVTVALEIDAPRGMPVAAQTFNGNLDAAGFRAGAELTSNDGAVSVADVSGAVRTRVDEATQSLHAIRGDVDSVGIAGDIDLADVRAMHVSARVDRGRIRARGVRAPDVHLATISGDILFSAPLDGSGRYQITSYHGGVHVALEPGSAGFRLVTAAPRAPSIDGVALDDVETVGGVTRALSGDGGARLEIVTREGLVSIGVAGRAR